MCAAPRTSSSIGPQLRAPFWNSTTDHSSVNRYVPGRAEAMVLNSDFEGVVQAWMPKNDRGARASKPRRRR